MYRPFAHECTRGPFDVISMQVGKVYREKEDMLNRKVGLLEHYVTVPTFHSPSEWKALWKEAGIKGVTSYCRPNLKKIKAKLAKLEKEEEVRPLLLTPTFLFYLTGVPFFHSQHVCVGVAIVGTGDAQCDATLLLFCCFILHTRTEPVGQVAAAHVSRAEEEASCRAPYAEGQGEGVA